MQKITLYKIDYTLDPRKVVKYKSEVGGELTDVLFKELSTRLGCDRLIKLEKTFNGLSVVVCTERQLTEEELKEINIEISGSTQTGEISIMLNEVSADSICKNSNLSPEDKQYLMSLGGTEGAEPEETETPQKSESEPKPRVQPETTKEVAEEEDVFELIEKLIAMDELKSWAAEMKGLLEKNLNSEMLKQSIMSMSYLVAVNSGNGRSEMLQMMGKVIAKLVGKVSVNVREIAVDPDKESKSYNVDKLLNEFGYVEENGPTLTVFALTVDKFLNNMHVAAWMNLVNAIWDNNKKAVFIFVVPYLEKATIFDMHKRIEDVLPNRIIVEKPLSNDDYMKFFELYFEKFDIKISKEAAAIIPKKIAEEKSDGRFYGINTVNKICDEILYNKMKKVLSSSDEEIKAITEEDITALIQNPSPWEEDNQTGLQQLDALVSLQEVKSVIREIIATIKMQQNMGVGAKKSLHMMFSGCPGTGKTVVARILGKILREEKILSVGGFYEVTRKDLVGMYVGHTAPKTAEVCQAAYGSVLFIDEAYMLDGGSENDYGKEAISTLIAEMENKRDNLVVIFAGYEKELQQLFELNPGLRDRIPYRVNFPSYSRDELKQIFFKMLPDEFERCDEFDEAANEFFANLSDDLMQDKHFSNARFVRNLVERIISKAALRMQMEEKDDKKMLFVKSDFDLAVSDGEFRSLNTKKSRAGIGFSV